MALLDELQNGVVPDLPNLPTAQGQIPAVGDVLDQINQHVDMNQKIQDMMHKQQNHQRRDKLLNMLSTFLFSVGQGLSVPPQVGGNAMQAAGAALQGPFLLQQMRQQQQQAAAKQALDAARVRIEQQNADTGAFNANVGAANTNSLIQNRGAAQNTAAGGLAETIRHNQATENAPSKPPAYINIPNVGLFDTKTQTVLPGTAAPKTPAAITPHTVVTEEGVFQYNPKSDRYDIRVGSRPKPSGSTINLGNSPDTIQSYIDWLSRGSMTIAQVPQAIRGTVLTEARKQGIAIISDTEREQLSSFDAAMEILKDIGARSAKVHTLDGIKARAEGALRQVKAATGSDPDVKLLQSKAGELSMLIRALGEKGTLAEGDVRRAINLIPVDPKLTKTEAEGMMSDLTTLIKNILGKKAENITKPLTENQSPGQSQAMPTPALAVRLAQAKNGEVIEVKPGVRVRKVGPDSFEPVQ